MRRDGDDESEGEEGGEDEARRHDDMVRLAEGPSGVRVLQSSVDEPQRDRMHRRGGVRGGRGGGRGGGGRGSPTGRVGLSGEGVAATELEGVAEQLADQ